MMKIGHPESETETEKPLYLRIGCLKPLRRRILFFSLVFVFVLFFLSRKRTPILHDTNLMNKSRRQDRKFFLCHSNVIQHPTAGLFTCFDAAFSFFFFLLRGCSCFICYFFSVLYIEMRLKIFIVSLWVGQNSIGVIRTKVYIKLYE